MHQKQVRLLPKDVYDADGAFVVGTATEVSGVQSLDKKPFRKPWNITHGYTLQKEYEIAIRQDVAWDKMA